jgi:hypothetical protein
LQRRAYESQGHRNWTNIEKDIPQTRDQKLFLDLPILKVTDRNEPSEVGLLLSMPSFMRSQWELAQQPVLKPRWSLKRLGKLFGRNSVREIEISKPIH